MGLVHQVDGGLRVQIVTDQILADDDHGHAGGAHVLLHTGPDQAVVGDVAGAGEEHGGLVGHQHMALGVGQLVPGGAVDGLVFADVDIVAVVGDVQIAAIGDVGEVLILGGGDDVHLAEFLGLGNGLLGPCAGFDIDRLAILHQIHRDHGKLQRCAALNEENLIVIGDPHQITQILLSLVDDGLENLRTVRHLHNAHTGAAVVQQLVADLFQHRNGHGRGTGGEIISTVVHRGTSCHCSGVPGCPKYTPCNENNQP